MKTLKTPLILFSLLINFAALVAQEQVNNSYFIINNPLRHQFNASFQPNADLYFSAPFFGQTQFSVNMPVSLSDMVKKIDGQERWFIDKNWSNGRKQFLDVLGNNPSLDFDFEMNLLSFGFRLKNSYITFALSEKIVANAYLPRGLFDVIFDGLAPNGAENNAFNLNVGLDVSAYTEVAFGYSLAITDELTAGVKLKALFGQGNVSLRNENLKLYTGIDYWRLEGAETWNVSLPAEQILDADHNLKPKFSNDFTKYLTSGVGGAIDLGIDYKFKNIP
ncbi:MAG: DUF5723 family protein, partial [Paludibacter sp.]|nr:DUF5723 family protein [Paludibacter sp.]